MVMPQEVVTQQSVESNTTSCVSVSGQELEWDVGCVVDNMMYPEHSFEQGGKTYYWCRMCIMCIGTVLYMTLFKPFTH